MSKLLKNNKKPSWDCLKNRNIKPLSLQKSHFFDSRKHSLIEKMPAMPPADLHNGLVTAPEMRPRVFGSSCQAVPIAPFAPKQSPFSAQDVSRAWKDYFESLLKSRCLGWVHDQCYWPFLDQIFIKQAQGILAWPCQTEQPGLLLDVLLLLHGSFWFQNNFFKEMGECLQQDKEFTGPGFLITFRQAWKYHRPCW